MNGTVIVTSLRSGKMAERSALRFFMKLKM
jgi:hypothetical protein